MTSGSSTETFALETRAEQLNFLSGADALRRGETDLLEIGSGSATDAVSGSETTRVGGNLREKVEGDRTISLDRLETEVEGKLTLDLSADTTLLGGVMTDLQAGAVFVGAGMSDDLIVGAGMRVTLPVDFWHTRLIGMEEKVGTAAADVALLELYYLAFEREYKTGLHAAAAASFTGQINVTTAAGFMQLTRVSMGVRDLSQTAAAGEGGQPGGGATPPSNAAANTGAAAASGATTAGSGALVTARGASDMGDFEDIGALEDIRHTFDDQDAILELEEARVAVERSEQLQDSLRLADLEDVGDLEDVRGIDDAATTGDDTNATRHFDASPEIVGEPRELQGDDLARWQELNDDANWMEDIFGETMMRAEDFENSTSVDAPVGAANQNPVVIEQNPEWVQTLTIDEYRQRLNIPEGWNFGDQRQAFYNDYQDFLKDLTPGSSILRDAHNSAADIPVTQFENLPASWTDDITFATDTPTGTDYYNKIVEMEALARQSGDTVKADYLAGVLANIDAQQMQIYADARAAADEMRPLGQVPFPENTNTQQMMENLDLRLQQLGDEQADILANPNYATDPELQRRFEEVTAQTAVYNISKWRIEEGYNPTFSLSEYVALSGSNYAGTDELHKFEAILDAQDNVTLIFGDATINLNDARRINFEEARRGRGLEDFEFAEYVATSHDEMMQAMNDSQPGASILMDARADFESIVDTQWDALDSNLLDRYGYLDDAGNLKPGYQEAADANPLNKVIILQDMEKQARAAGDHRTADMVGGILMNIDAQIKSRWEAATSVVDQIYTRALATPFGASPENLTDLQTRLATDLRFHADMREKVRAAMFDEYGEFVGDAHQLKMIDLEIEVNRVAADRIADGVDPRAWVEECVRLAQRGVDDMDELKEIWEIYVDVMARMDIPVAAFDPDAPFVPIRFAPSVGEDVDPLPGLPGGGGLEDPFLDVDNRPAAPLPSDAGRGNEDVLDDVVRSGNAGLDPSAEDTLHASNLPDDEIRQQLSIDQRALSMESLEEAEGGTYGTTGGGVLDIENRLPSPGDTGEAGGNRGADIGGSAELADDEYGVVGERESVLRYPVFDPVTGKYMVDENGDRIYRSTEDFSLRNIRDPSEYVPGERYGNLSQSDLQRYQEQWKKMGMKADFEHRWILDLDGANDPARIDWDGPGSSSLSVTDQEKNYWESASPYNYWLAGKAETPGGSQSLDVDVDTYRRLGGGGGGAPTDADPGVYSQLNQSTATNRFGSPAPASADDMGDYAQIRSTINENIDPSDICRVPEEPAGLLSDATVTRGGGNFDSVEDIENMEGAEIVRGIEGDPPAEPVAPAQTRPAQKRKKRITFERMADVIVYQANQNPQHLDSNVGSPYVDGNWANAVVPVPKPDELELEVRAEYSFDAGPGGGGRSRLASGNDLSSLAPPMASDGTIGDMEGLNRAISETRESRDAMTFRDKMSQFLTMTTWVLEDIATKFRRP